MYWMGYVKLKRKDSFQNRSIRLKVIYAHCTVGRVRLLRVPEGTRYPVFKITTRTLLEKFYYPAG